MRIEKTASVVAHTNDYGYRDWYPTYHVHIDGDEIASQFVGMVTSKSVEYAIEASKDEIENAINRIINSHLRGSVSSPTHCRVYATVEHERPNGRGDTCYVGEEMFDCVLALDNYKLSNLPPESDLIRDDGWLDYGDELFYDSVYLGLAHDWDGPFTVYVNSDDYDSYIAARVRNEYGRELR